MSQKSSHKQRIVWRQYRTYFYGTDGQLCFTDSFEAKRISNGASPRNKHRKGRYWRNHSSVSQHATQQIGAIMIAYDDLSERGINLNRCHFKTARLQNNTYLPIADWDGTTNQKANSWKDSKARHQYLWHISQ